jgi:hypothetical protein
MSDNRAEFACREAHRYIAKQRFRVLAFALEGDIFQIEHWAETRKKSVPVQNRGSHPAKQAA